MAGESGLRARQSDGRRGLPRPRAKCSNSATGKCTVKYLWHPGPKVMLPLTMSKTASLTELK